MKELFRLCNRTVAVTGDGSENFQFIKPKRRSPVHVFAI